MTEPTTSPSEREFALGDVLSVTTGRLVSSMSGVWDVLNFMTGDDLCTHALPRAAQECRPALFARHPWLSAVEVPAVFEADDVASWLAEQEAVYGATVVVPTLAACEVDYQPVDPITELLDMMGER
jgi:hypothetical protein